MYYGNQPYGQQIPYNNGYNYGAVQPPKRSNVLSAEQIAGLRQKAGGFTLALTKDEVERGQCTHIDENGQPSYITNPDGTTTCTICGHTWRSVDVTKEEVEKAVQVILDILQTIKIMYVNMPEQAGREFFQIIPMLWKVPQLYQVAADNFRSYEGNLAGYMNGTANPFALFGSVVGNQGYANMWQYNQTQPQNMVYGQQYQQVAGANPFDANAYPGQYAAQPNPYVAPQQPYTPGAYAPQVQGFTYNPGQPAASPTPVAPATQTAAQPAAAPVTQPAEVTSTGNHTP
jgi:hypothetical protein